MDLFFNNKEHLNLKESWLFAGSFWFFTAVIGVSELMPVSANNKAENNVGMLIDSVMPNKKIKSKIKPVKIILKENKIKKSKKSVNIKNNKIKISDKGKANIKKFENLSLVSYRIKGENSNTIGYGHKINSDDPLWLRRKYIGYSITKQEADQIFNNDIKNFIEPAIKRLFSELNKNDVNTDQFNQDFIDGLGSIIYNCGEEGIRKSEFFKQLKKGRISKAVKLISNTHVYMEGHKERRKFEQELMS